MKRRFNIKIQQNKAAWKNVIISLWSYWNMHTPNPLTLESLLNSTSTELPELYKVLGNDEPQYLPRPNVLKNMKAILNKSYDL